MEFALLCKQVVAAEPHLTVIAACLTVFRTDLSFGTAGTEGEAR